MSCCGPASIKTVRQRRQNIYFKSGGMQTNTQEIAINVGKDRSFCLPRKRKPPKGCCVDVGSNNPIEYPDPGIYSQYQQLLLGNAPSWDNPDILTNNWGPFKLMDESKVTVHNFSASASAINTLVHFYTSPFGIGTQRTLIQSKMVSLAPNSQTQLNFPLPKDVLNGDQRIGVHIRIEHPTDNNSQNNEGSQVHDGSFTTESGRNFILAIPVLNNSNFNRQILLSIMPTDLIATVSNSNHTYAAFEQIIAQLHIQVPAFLVGSPGNIIHRAVTVVGRLTSGELVGGATKLLRINN